MIDLLFMPEQQDPWIRFPIVPCRALVSRRRLFVKFPGQPGSIENAAVFLFDRPLDGVDGLIERITIGSIDRIGHRGDQEFNVVVVAMGAQVVLGFFNRLLDGFPRLAALAVVRRIKIVDRLQEWTLADGSRRRRIGRSLFFIGVLALCHVVRNRRADGENAKKSAEDDPGQRSRFAVGFLVGISHG